MGRPVPPESFGRATVCKWSETGLKLGRGRELQVITVIDDELNSCWDIPGKAYNISGDSCFLNLHQIDQIVSDNLFPISNDASMCQETFPQKLLFTRDFPIYNCFSY